MEHMEIERQDLKKSEQSSLLPGLPDDIALCCLAKVPRKLLYLLKCVSKRWNELVSGEEWHAYRVKHHLEETWIYALCKDISDQLCLYVLDTYELKKGWKRINGIPDQCLKRKGVGFEVLGKNVFLIGGCGWIEDATEEVYCYDASANKWAEASPLASARCYFGCESVDGKIYAIGGIVPKPSNRYSYDIYTPQKNNWTTYEDSNVRPHIEDSVVLDEKIYVRCCASTALTSHVRAVVYEPSSATWQVADRDLVSGWRGPAVVINGIFYVLDQTSGVKLIMWDKSSREWISLRRFSTHFISPPCQLVGIGNRMFIIGKGLSTVVFDVANIGRVDGVLVSSSVPKLTTDDEVIKCRALSL